MDADKQIGLHLSGLLHSHMQGNKVVGVAREIGANGVAIDRTCIDTVAQAVRQTQHHVLFARAAGPDGAGILAAMTGVECDDDQAVGGGARLRFDLDFRLSLRWPGRRLLTLLCDQIAQRIGLGLRCGIFLQPFSNQCLQRVGGLRRIEVKHQSVLVGGHRCQGKYLGRDRLLQVQHQAHHTGSALSHPDARDRGVVGAHFGHQCLEGRIELDAFNVHRQPRRTGDEKLLDPECCVGLDGDARIVGRWPDPHRQNSGSPDQLTRTQ